MRSVCSENKKQQEGVVVVAVVVVVVVVAGAQHCQMATQQRLVSWEQQTLRR